MAEQRNRPLPGPAPADHTVRLRPIAGLAPGTYLTLLYGAALLALLFLVAVYPGLRFNGSLITFSSSPPGAAVYLDGRFAGTTPVTSRAAAGPGAPCSCRRSFFSPEKKSSRWAAGCS